MDPRRILITRTDRLGDVVLSTPVIRHMRGLYPEAHIAFMVRPENRGAVINNPDLDEVILYDKRGSHRSLWKTFLFARSLAEKKFDAAIALHPTNRAHMIFFIAGIPARIGYDRKMPWLLTKRVPHLKHLGREHEIEYNFRMLQEAGFDVSGADRAPYIVTSQEDKDFVDSVIRDKGLSGDNMIAAHAGASCPSKRWMPESFARTADSLSEGHGSEIVLVGGGETIPVSGEVARRMKKKPADLTGKLSVGQLAELLSRCRLFVSNDSGPVHVAVAVGTPSVVIFGRNYPGLSPERWGPFGDNNAILHKDVGCEKCLAHNCDKDFKCLRAVAVEEVLSAASKIIR